MGCFNSKTAFSRSGEPDGREVAVHYRTLLITKLDNPTIAMSKRIEVEEELDRFMGFSEREQEIYAYLRLAPATRPVSKIPTGAPAMRQRSRPKTMHSRSSCSSSSGSSVDSTTKIPIVVTMHETVP
ncbi:hypothetical protein PG985_013019 [Apiospora marii]|uniref:Uncharacterized protein n=1 Tax=Apiospora marii TaxID=335849 RepID=A0ABR1R914_9PEZI